MHHHTKSGDKMFGRLEDIIWTKSTFTDTLKIHCDLDLECSNPVFPHDTLAYDTVLLSQAWLQTDQQFRRYSRNSHIFYCISPHCDLDTPPHDSTPPYQVWYIKKMMEWFWRYCVDTIGHMDRMTDGQSDSSILLCRGRGGGWMGWG